jgi:hypothetical protein
MRKTLRAALLLSGMHTIDGCEDSLATLNWLAVAGSIHEDAPVTTHRRFLTSMAPNDEYLTSTSDNS